MKTTIRKQLLEVFSDHEGKYVSGQKISEQLGCSRTAVWKHIENLRHEGYELEAVPRKGYRIINKPDKITENEIRLGLKTTSIGSYVHYEDSVHSTQKIAHKLANEGAPEGTVVVADEQKIGRGRLDRSWFSPKSTGIWMSIVLRPEIPPQQSPQLTLLVAVSVVRGIFKATGIDCQIKWPNDVLINGRKVVGILTELQSESDRINAVIIGIGVNVNQQSSHFPKELREKATSLAIEKGERINRANIIQAIFKELEDLYIDYLKEGFSVVKMLWESHAISIGKQITAKTLKGTIQGKAIGITDDGVLMLEDEMGQLHYIYSADIEITPTT